jgi:hypothetical protein
MPDDIEYRENSEAVRAHLSIMQSVIQRMAADSSSCKAWCIALVSAILVIVADKRKPEYTSIALIPTLLFLVLDAYYLALEYGFRESYNAFIEKLHRGRVQPRDLYAVRPAGSVLRHFLRSLRSFSVWPLYSALLGMIFLARRLLM